VATEVLLAPPAPPVLPVPPGLGGGLVRARGLGSRLSRGSGSRGLSSGRGLGQPGLRASAGSGLRAGQSATGSLPGLGGARSRGLAGLGAGRAPTGLGLRGLLFLIYFFCNCGCKQVRTKKKY
jgi:hypothetical protein